MTAVIDAVMETPVRFGATPNDWHHFTILALGLTADLVFPAARGGVLSDTDPERQGAVTPTTSPPNLYAPALKRNPTIMTVSHTAPDDHGVVVLVKRGDAPYLTIQVHPIPSGAQTFDVEDILGTAAEASAADAREATGLHRLPRDHVEAGVLRDLVGARLAEGGLRLVTWLRTYLDAVGVATVAQVPPALRLQLYVETRLAMRLGGAR